MLLADVIASTLRTAVEENDEARLARISADPLTLITTLRSGPQGRGTPIEIGGVEARIRSVIAGMLGHGAEQAGFRLTESASPAEAKPREQRPVIDGTVIDRPREALALLLLALIVTASLAIWLL
ncbi:MAG: hypothetical protein HY245_05065 [Rhizobiales bacterium]|nr:hypothetical protein [Hyphomicrobiales bacterium]MBI3672784.1 hypothetical protein [Hyphomicrobiales bacterium]